MVFTVVNGGNDKMCYIWKMASRRLKQTKILVGKYLAYAGYF